MGPGQVEDEQMVKTSIRLSLWYPSMCGHTYPLLDTRYVGKKPPRRPVYSSRYPIGERQLNVALKALGCYVRDNEWYCPESQIVAAQTIIDEFKAAAKAAEMRQHEAAKAAAPALAAAARAKLMPILEESQRIAAAGPTGHETRMIHHDPVDGEGNLASEGGYISSQDEEVPVPAEQVQAGLDRRVRDLERQIAEIE